MSSDFMLCNSIKEEEFKNMNLSDFIAELKEDGERIIAVKEGLQVWLFNRRGREKSAIYKEVVRELEGLKDNFIIDGEITTTDGLFNSLQHRSNLSDRQKIKEAEFKYPITFWVFDILMFDKENLRGKPLIERKKHLECLRGLKSIQVLNHFEGEQIRKLWDYVKENNREGIILKQRNSIYTGTRTNNWIKLKTWKNVEISFSYYEVNDNSSITAYNDEGIRCLVSGQEVENVKREIEENGKVDLKIKYLEKTKEGKYRFIHLSKDL